MKITKHNFTIPAISIDNFLPSENIVRAAAESFNDIDDNNWIKYTAEQNQIQYCTPLNESKPEPCQLILDYIALNLNPDKLFDGITNNTFPDISHYGGGMMLTPNFNGEGGYLGMHIDAAIHGLHDDWKREYSAILCISEEYDSSFDCLLHDGEDHIRLPYKFNRLNIFKCTENSWHGFPEITKGLDRKTLGVMYWSKLNEKDKSKDFVKAQFNNNLEF